MKSLSNHISYSDGMNVHHVLVVRVEPRKGIKYVVEGVDFSKGLRKGKSVSRLEG